MLTGQGGTIIPACLSFCFQNPKPFPHTQHLGSYQDLQCQKPRFSEVMSHNFAVQNPSPAPKPSSAYAAHEEVPGSPIAVLHKSCPCIDAEALPLAGSSKRSEGQPCWNPTGTALASSDFCVLLLCNSQLTCTEIHTHVRHVLCCQLFPVMHVQCPVICKY